MLLIALFVILCILFFILAGILLTVLILRYMGLGVSLLTIDADAGAVFELRNRGDKETRYTVYINVAILQYGARGSVRLEDFVMGPREVMVITVPLNSSLTLNVGSTCFVSYIMQSQRGAVLATSRLELTTWSRITASDPAYVALIETPPAYQGERPVELREEVVLDVMPNPAFVYL